MWTNRFFYGAFDQIVVVCFTAGDYTELPMVSIRWDEKDGLEVASSRLGWSLLGVGGYKLLKTMNRACDLKPHGKCFVYLTKSKA